jgi:hypothetical protein
VRAVEARHPLAAVAAVGGCAEAAAFIFAPVEMILEAVDPGRMLSAAETARIARILDPAERARRTAAHALKRLAIAAALDVSPAALAFGRTHDGAPTVAGRGDFGLSLAHAGDWVAVGIGRGCAVGVDVEVRSGGGWAALIDAAIAEGAPAGAGATAEDWCRLEACLKLAGGWRCAWPATATATVKLDLRHAAAAARPIGAAARAFVVR